MKRIAALCLALLCLSSCAGMLEREYTVTGPHVENPPIQGDAYRVDTYRALGPALLSYIEEGERQGTLRFPTTYAGNIRVDLEKACRELMENDPLGNYALADVDFHISKIIAFYDADLTFTYKLDPSQFRSLLKINTQAALVRRLTDALTNGEEQIQVYLTAYPEEDESYFTAALEEAWTALAQDPQPVDVPEPGDVPEAPEGYDASVPPTVRVALYPQSGPRRVAVLTLEREVAEDG